MKRYFLVTFAVFFCSLSNTWACPSVLAAHRLYIEGRQSEAIEALVCLQKQYPDDLDVQVLLSDIDWWNGRAENSIERAKNIEKLNPWPLDPDLAIHVAKRTHAWRFTLAGDDVWGNGNTGLDISSVLDYRLPDRDHVSAGFSRLSRTYAGASTSIDRVFLLNYTRLQGKRSYLEFDAGYSPDHSFSPQFSIGIEPHTVLQDDSDISLLLKYLHYVNASSRQEVALFSPGWRKIIHHWTLSGHATILISSDLLPSAQTMVSYEPLPKTEVSISASGGKTLEGPNLADIFYSFGGALKRFLRPELALKLDGSIYRADFYSENRLGLGVDWFF